MIVVGELMSFVYLSGTFCKFNFFTIDSATKIACNHDEPDLKAPLQIINIYSISFTNISGKNINNNLASFKSPLIILLKNKNKKV